MKSPESAEQQPAAAEPAFLHGVSMATRAMVLSTGLRARVDESFNRERKTGSGAPRLYRPQAGRNALAGSFND
ncbi:hypothetical protein GCM10025867_47270 (plasmid) [Frondihabitans sucicola]|uniref:Uncharacterized protein n=1 Tax=Frondihabitans sucicola TaxID=1268041 RepID=A0ABM8GVU1_9MICO|nr:hypothetical protein [Frondihabitans sucicola]BDZ52486.1 hypothetical protein GCM10025867_47270 [Frondihabitans sucicola]